MDTPSHELVYEVHLITNFPASKFEELVKEFRSVGQVGRYQALRERFPNIELLAITDGAGFSDWSEKDQRYRKFYVRVPVGKFEEVWERITSVLERATA